MGTSRRSGFLCIMYLEYFEVKALRSQGVIIHFCRLDIRNPLFPLKFRYQEGPPLMGVHGAFMQQHRCGVAINLSYDRRPSSPSLLDDNRRLIA